jgi:hypothetical protein
MGLKKDYLGFPKLNAGPGGWHCPCCNAYGCCARKMKDRAHRLFRRVAKLNLHKEEF